MLARNVYIVRCLRSFQRPRLPTLAPRYTSSGLPFPYDQWVTEQEVKDEQVRKAKASHSAEETQTDSKHGRDWTLDRQLQDGLEKPVTTSPAPSIHRHLKAKNISQTKSSVQVVSKTPRKSHNGGRVRRFGRGTRHLRARVVRKVTQPEAILVPKARRFLFGAGRYITMDIDPLAKRKKQPLRSRYISLSSWKSIRSNQSVEDTLQSLSSLWSQRFANISRDRNSIYFRGSWAHRIQQLLSPEMDRESIIKAWMNIRLSKREVRWHEVMLWALQNSPERALKLLDASVTTPRLRPSRHVVEDCINYLSTFYLEGKESSDPLKIDTLLRIICNFAEASIVRSPGVSAMPQHAIFLLLQHCENDQVVFLFETLRRRDAVIHENTLLHFFKRFVDMGKISLPLEILRSLVTSGVDVSSDKIQSACVRFLRFPFHVENRYNIQSSLLAAILEIGIRPGIFMYNAIILNTIQAGDCQTAWHMYEMARENSLKPDAVTYSTMLKGAKQHLDFGIIDCVVRDAEEDGNLPRDERLVRDVLDAIFALELNKMHRPTFTALLPTYTRYCDTCSLQALGMVLNKIGPPKSQSQVRPPSSRTVGLMILAYIRQHQDSDSLLRLYMRYHNLVQENDPVIAPLAKTDHIANAFIMALGRKPQSLEYCTLVIKHMLQPPEVGEVTKSVKFAVPTVQTWSILIAAYFRHGQKLAVKKVLSMMEARGLQPNKVTWNILVSGYSQMQDVDNAVGTMQQMEAAGFDADARTLEGLGRLRDRDRVMEALRKATEGETEVEQQMTAFGEGSTIEVLG